MSQSDINQPVPVELLQRYYREIFDPDDLISIVGLTTIYKREFAFLVESEMENENPNTTEHFIRNISFKTTSELKKYMAENKVKRGYVGAVYEIPPSRTNTIQRIKWISREFCFDLDLNDYDLVRVCGCRGKEQHCSVCWTLVQDAADFLDRTLREDFGYKDIEWVFSGRRGFHAWVKDKRAGHLTQQQRNSIINYLAVIRDERRTQSVEKDLKSVLPLRDRIIEMIAKSFFEHATDKELRASPLRFNKNQILRLKSNLEQGTMSFSQIYENILENRQKRDDIFDHIIRSRYPRIDRKVSIDLRRILKIPGSVQDTNGRIVCKVDIKKVHNFYPENAPSIWEMF
jgi:predicted DNA primase small subunit